MIPVVHANPPDTGWRDVTSLFANPSFTLTRLHLRRAGLDVWGRIQFAATQTATTHQILGTWPSGFAPDGHPSGAQRFAIVGEASSGVVMSGLVNAHQDGLYVRHNGAAAAGSAAMFIFTTSDPWPTVYPGTPA